MSAVHCYVGWYSYSNGHQMILWALYKPLDEALTFFVASACWSGLSIDCGGWNDDNANQPTRRSAFAVNEGRVCNSIPGTDYFRVFQMNGRWCVIGNDQATKAIK